MDVLNVNIAEIKPYENNPRNNDNAVDKVAESIKLFGFRIPVVLDKNNVIVCGHTRYKASQKLGLKELPCTYAKDLSQEQINAFRIIDNKTAEYADWDYNKLALEIEDVADLSDLDLNFFDLEAPDINMDDFDTDFSLPDGEKSEFATMTFTLHERQKELIEYALSLVKENATETFGNTNANGNGLYEVVKQWAELKKLN